MSKGELKKRIKEALPDWWEQTGGDNYIVWALDEAETEFPKLSKKANTADRILHSIECLEWVEKWFGE